MSTDRFERQDGLVPREPAAAAHATIIGVGAVGRPLALQLAAIGVGRLTLIDPDCVELVNVTTQGYYESQIGMRKVAATCDALRMLRQEDGLSVKTIASEFSNGMPLGDAVFCAVDKIAARSFIWQLLQDNDKVPNFWCDVRMMGETIRLLTATRSDPESIAEYGLTLFAPEEAQPGRCTARSTIYAASMAACLAVHQFTRYLRNYPCDRGFVYNLLSNELFIGNPEKLDVHDGLDIVA